MKGLVKVMVPLLTSTSQPDLYREAKGILLRLTGTPKEKADIFEQLAIQIRERTNGAWNFARGIGTDGSHVFMGNAGPVIVIDPQGKIWRGELNQGVKILFGTTTIEVLEFEIDYNKIRDISL